MKAELKRLLSLLGICVLVFAAALFAFPPKAHGKAVAAGEAGNVSIVLTDEPCKLPAVINLPHRSTWTEKGKTTEGCWGLHPDFPVVMTYWADKTVSVFHIGALHPVTEAQL